MASEHYTNIEYLSTLEEWKGGFDYTLDNIKSVLALLDNPQNFYDTYHVTGTNGKGSTCAFLASFLSYTDNQAKNNRRRVGFSSSPHLCHVNERIRLDGLPIHDEKLDRYLGVVRGAADSIGVELTYFEFVTATAFLSFREEAVDKAVIEVGLGGMKDATNVLSAPKANVIVSIGRDHEHILGSSTTLIARDKAQIIKPGAQVVVGRLRNGELQEVYRVTEKVGASVSMLGKDFDLIPQSEARATYSSEQDNYEFEVSLAGAHQLDNAAIALRVMEKTGESLTPLLPLASTVHWPARLESQTIEGREVLLDCAHNVEGIKTLTAYLKARGMESVNFLFGVLQTKRWQEMVGELAPFAARVFVLEPKSKRALPASALVDYLSSNQISAIECSMNYTQAVNEALHATDAGTPLVVVGSMYMVASVREELGLPEVSVW